MRITHIPLRALVLGSVAVVIVGLEAPSIARQFTASLSLTGQIFDMPEDPGSASDPTLPGGLPTGPTPAQPLPQNPTPNPGGNGQMPTDSGGAGAAGQECEGDPALFSLQENVPQGQTIVRVWKRKFDERIQSIVATLYLQPRDAEECRKSQEDAAMEADRIVKQFLCVLSSTEARVGTAHTLATGPETADTVSDRLGAIELMLVHIDEARIDADGTMTTINKLTSGYCDVQIDPDDLGSSTDHHAADEENTNNPSNHLPPLQPPASNPNTTGNPGQSSDDQNPESPGDSQNPNTGNTGGPSGPGGEPQDQPGADTSPNDSESPVM